MTDQNTSNNSSSTTQSTNNETPSNGVVQLTVCDSQGSTTKNAGEIANQVIIKGTDNNIDKNFYAFKATTGGTENNKVKTVYLTIPVGGDQNGLLRLPRVGEKILAVQAEDNSYYLLSYVPDITTLDFRKEDATTDDKKEKSAVDDEALTLRYKSPNPLPVDSTTKKDNICSELKFSTQKTFWYTGIPIKVTKGSDNKWKDENDKEYSSKKVVVDDKDKDTGKVYEKKDIDEIDRIDLTSTGDILTTAGSYNEVNARRIALFSDRKDEDVEKSRANILQGDIVYSAKNRIILNAKNEIIIQCGRSAIKMNDTGIQIISAKVDPTALVGNDSQINLSSRKGISVIGSNIEAKATTSFMIADGCGGYITSMAGMTRINARDVEVVSQNNLQAGFNFAASMWQYLATGSAYYANESDTTRTYTTQRTPSAIGSLGTASSLLWRFIEGDYRFGLTGDETKATHTTEKTVKGFVEVQNEGNTTNKDNKTTEVTAKVSKNEFESRTYPACTTVADLALSIGYSFMQVLYLALDIVELRDGGNRAELNKIAHWVEQGIVETINGVCFVCDLVPKKTRIDTGVQVSSLRFHGGFGDLECSSVNKNVINDIATISKDAGTNFFKVSAGFGMAGSLLGATDAFIPTANNDLKEELDTL